jgi:hypothetical protein
MRGMGRQAKTRKALNHAGFKWRARDDSNVRPLPSELCKYVKMIAVFVRLPSFGLGQDEHISLFA